MSGATGKGSSPAGYTTTTQGPSSAMLPYIGTGANEAAGLLAGNGPQYYPGQQVAGFTPQQQQAFTGLGTLDSGLMTGSGNPYENAMFDQAATATQNQLTSEYGTAGRSVGESEALRGQQLNNLATSIYGGQYQNDVANAMNAGNQLLQVGNQQQTEAQNLINANMAKYNYYQQQPYQRLGTYESEIGALNGGSQSSEPYFTNPLGSLLGYAQLGSSLYGGGNGGSSGGGKGKGNSAGAPNSLVDSSSLNQPMMPIYGSGYSGGPTQ